MKLIILLCLMVVGVCGEFHLLRHRRQAYHPPPQPQANYRPLNQAPGNIQQLLQLQQYREPLVHLPPQKAPNLGQAPAQPQLTNQAQVSQYKPNVQYGQAPQQPTYENQAAAIAAQYKPQGGGHQPHQGHPQYQG